MRSIHKMIARPSLVVFATIVLVVGFQNCMQSFYGRRDLLGSTNLSSSAASCDPGPNDDYAACGVDDPTLTRLSQLVTEGKDVLIPAGQTVLLDQAPAIGLLQIQGQLKCPRGGTYTLKVQGIQVYGTGAVFECGTPNSRFLGKLNIELNPGRVVMDGERTFVAFDNGTLQFAGRGKNYAWLHLAETAEAGSKQIKLSDRSDWSAGDQIVVAPTGLDPHEAEEITIDSVSSDGRVIELKTALAYRHWGGVQKFEVPSKEWSLDESAEVANLSRNIRIYAPGDATSLDSVGGHTMIMATAKAYIDGIELIHMGQMGKMARYPFHWHRAGDVNGQYITNSSIHASFQRCVTVHGSNNALVKNNVCFDHFGHGFFLEDGNETGNQIIGNLGILTKRPPRTRNLLESDVDLSTVPRWAGPATFWISNPNNVISGNVAAGSEGSGYWNSFVDKVACDDVSCRVLTDATVGNVFPSKQPTLDFSSNTSHTNLVGMSWDGTDQGDLTNNPRNPNDRLLVAVHYSPTSMPTAHNLNVFKNLHIGIYFRGQPYTFDQSIFADNGTSIWLAYNQKVSNSAVVGFSQNHSDADLAYASSHGQDSTYLSGTWLYDGPLEMTNVDFIGFPSTQATYQGRDVTPVPFRTVGGANRYPNRVQGLTFTPEPLHRFILAPDNWMDSPYTLHVRDLDGSLMGVANSTLVPVTSYAKTSRCVEISGTQAMRCPYSEGSIFFGGLNYAFQMIRNDGVASPALTDITPNVLFAKIGLILDGGYEYSMRFGFDIADENYHNFNFQTEHVGQMSPVIRAADVGTSCDIANTVRVGSLDELRAATKAASWSSGQDIYMKLIATDTTPLAPGITGTGGYAIRCLVNTTGNSLLSPLVFDSKFYRQNYSDLNNMTADQARDHWLNIGTKAGRTASATFNVRNYIERYADIKAAFGTDYTAAINHFVVNGHAEGRNGL